MADILKPEIVVDNNVVQRILSDAKLKHAFPSLVAASRPPTAELPKKKTCGACNKPVQQPLDFMSVKRAIASLPAAQLEALKAHLKTKKLRISYAGVAGEAKFFL